MRMTADRKYHPTDGNVLPSPPKMSTFMPKKETMNVNGRNMTVIHQYEDTWSRKRCNTYK